MIQYSTNLTDKQYQVIKKIINTQERKLKLQKLWFNLRSVKRMLNKFIE